MGKSKKYADVLCTELPLYRCWLRMKSRCHNEKDTSFPNYGGRGITVCEEWSRSFESFRRDVGEHPGNGFSLDRINNDGNYQPGNVKWSSRSEQQSNRRTSYKYRPGFKSIAEYKALAEAQRNIPKGEFARCPICDTLFIKTRNKQMFCNRAHSNFYARVMHPLRNKQYLERKSSKMKALLTPEHKKAGMIFLAIFALTAIMFFSSCSASREGTTSPCWSTKHMVGYGPGGFGRGRMKN